MQKLANCNIWQIEVQFGAKNFKFSNNFRNALSQISKNLVKFIIEFISGYSIVRVWALGLGF